jgi:hypothetical protein
MRMCVPRWLLALPLSALLLGGTPSPAAADMWSPCQFCFVPCFSCSLPGTWVFSVPPPGQTSSGYSLFTFNGEGTLIVSEAFGDPTDLNQAFHGEWVRVDTFRYSMSAIRQIATGWQRIRVVVAHDGSCKKLKGEIKVDTLTCPGANATCDPQGSGWALTAGPTLITAKAYERYPFSFNP